MAGRHDGGGGLGFPPEDLRIKLLVARATVPKGPEYVHRLLTEVTRDEVYARLLCSCVVDEAEAVVGSWA